MTLEDLKNLTYEQRWRGLKAAHTALHNAEDVVSILGHDKEAHTLKTTDIDKLKDKLWDRGLKPATVNRKLAALRTMMRMGHQRGIVKTLPHFSMEREPEHRMRVLSDDEVAAVINQMGEPYNDMVSVLVDTGMRVGELLKLDWNGVSIHPTSGDVHIRGTKGGRPRMVPLTARARAAIERQRTWPAGPFVRITYDALEHQWSMVRKAMGMIDDKEFVLHALRHTCASRLVRNGVSLQVVKEWLGHRDFSTTLRYAHLDQSALRNAMGALEQ